MQKYVFLNPSELKPYFRNPRKNELAVIELAENIKSIGFKRAIHCDENLEIVCGHTAWKAALLLNLKKVPVCIDDEWKLKDHPEVPPEEVKRIHRIADNKLGEKAEWDPILLNDEIQHIVNKKLGIKLTGFTTEEIDEMLEKYNYEYNPVEEIENFDESINFIIKCNSIKELEDLQKRFRIKGSMIKYEYFIKSCFA